MVRDEKAPNRFDDNQKPKKLLLLCLLAIT